MPHAQPPGNPTDHGRHRSRGQALVEFALIIPVFMLIFFGTIEFSLILASVGGFSFAARDAARIGTFIGRSDPNVDAKIVADANARVQALVMAKGLEVDIYRATPDGQCYTTPSGGGTSVSVTDPTCAANRYNMDGSAYGGSSALWPVGDRDDTLENADYLGVRIVYQYNWLTAFVADSGVALNLSATSVQRIEPLQFSRHHVTAPVASAQSWLSAVGAPIGGPWTALTSAAQFAPQALWRRVVSWAEWI